MKTLYRKYFYLLIFPLLGLIIACSSDDEDDIGTAEDLVGTWTFESASLEFLLDGTDLIQWLIDNLELTNAQADQFQDVFEGTYTDDLDGTLTFNED